MAWHRTPSPVSEKGEGQDRTPSEALLPMPRPGHLPLFPGPALRPLCACLCGPASVPLPLPPSPCPCPGVCFPLRHVMTMQ